MGRSVILAKVRQILQLSHWLVLLGWSHLLVRINQYRSRIWTGRLLAALPSRLCHQGLSCLCNLPHSHMGLLLIQLLRQDLALRCNYRSLLFFDIIHRDIGHCTCNSTKASNSQVCFRDFHQQYWLEQCWNRFCHRAYQRELGICLPRLCDASCRRSPSARTHDTDSNHGYRGYWVRHQLVLRCFHAFQHRSGFPGCRQHFDRSPDSSAFLQRSEQHRWSYCPRGFDHLYRSGLCDCWTYLAKSSLFLIR